MISSFKYLRILSILLSAIVFTACGVDKGNSQESSSKDNTQVTITISGPDLANEGESVVLVAESEPHDADLHYVWTQVGGEPVEWIQTDNQIKVSVPRVQRDSIYTFEVFAENGLQTSRVARHSISVTNVFDLQTTAQPAAKTAFDSTTKLLQFASLTRDLVFITSVWSDTQTLPCANGGLYTTTLIDNDGDARRSEGDRLTIEFRECNIKPFEAPITGELLIDLTDYSTPEAQWSAQISIIDLSIEDYETEQLNSLLKVEFDNSDLLRSMSIEAASGSIEKSGTKQYEFTNYRVTRTEDLRAATYSISASAYISDSFLGGDYAFEVTIPFVGYFNEYPHEGNATLSAKESDPLTLESNFVTNSRFLDARIGEFSYLLDWGSLTSSVFWSTGGTYAQDITEFRSDNFSFVGEIGQINRAKAPLNVAISFAFSRPVTGIENASAVFKKSSYPYDEIPAEVSIDGAVITVTPSQPLKPATTYSLTDIVAVGPFGQTAYASRISFTTSNAIAPVISTATNFYRYNDTPVLSAANSELNEGQGALYHWTEISKKGVEFSSPDDVSTSITVPAEVEGEIVIELTVSNELGDSASTQVTLIPLVDAATFIAIESEVGDYIGAGMTNQYTSASGTISSRSSLETPDEISIAFDSGSTWWNMDLKAPNGEPLSVQHYSDATRYPFQSPTAPGFSFSGSGRGCNQSYSEFEILELEYDEAGNLFRLAINFIQHCESPQAPALKGMVRFNSTLNQE